MKKQFSEDVQKLLFEMEYRNYSPRSVISYCQTMQAMENRLSKRLSDITEVDLKRYLHELITQKKCSNSSINQHISAYKIFIQDILKQDWESIRVNRPRRVQKLPVVLSLGEVERLIIAPRNIKHKAMIVLMYSAGLRLQEVLQMKPSAIDSERMRIHVSQGKGKKDRYTILSQKCLDILRVHFKINRPKVYLFEPNHRSEVPVSDSTLQHIVKQAAERAGLKKEISCHTLRHSFATHLLENGVNIKLIQQFLGHTSLKTTAVYLHLTNPNPESVRSPLEDMNF